MQLTLYISLPSLHDIEPKWPHTMFQGTCEHPNTNILNQLALIMTIAIQPEHRQHLTNSAT